MEKETHISKRVLCPSSLCGEGALLLGIIDSDGKVAYIKPAPIVGKEFVEEAHQQGRAPEHRFRFAAPCLEAGCAHWSGTRCGVIDQAKSASETTQHNIDSTHSLPKCAVRSECRWFEQIGAAACSVCPVIFNYVAPEAATHKNDTYGRTTPNKEEDDGSQ